jgi:bacterioferritin-associated ferredoxin
VTSDEVGTAIDNGAATLAQVARATGACTSCGTCKDRIRGMIGERGACPLAALRTAAVA